jgi:hypothetical protein
MRAKNVKQLSESFFLRGKRRLHFCAGAFSRRLACTRPISRGAGENRAALVKHWRRIGGGGDGSRNHAFFRASRGDSARNPTGKFLGHLKSASGVTYD